MALPMIAWLLSILGGVLIGHALGKPSPRVPLLPGQHWLVPGLGPVLVTELDYTGGLWRIHPRNVWYTTYAGRHATVPACDFLLGRLVSEQEYAVWLARKKLEAEADKAAEAEMKL